jgi:hypothetical protein
MRSPLSGQEHQLRDHVEPERRPGLDRDLNLLVGQEGAGSGTKAQHVKRFRTVCEGLNLDPSRRRTRRDSVSGYAQSGWMSFRVKVHRARATLGLNPHFHGPGLTGQELQGRQGKQAEGGSRCDADDEELLGAKRSLAQYDVDEVHSFRCFLGCLDIQSDHVLLGADSRRTNAQGSGDFA